MEANKPAEDWEVIMFQYCGATCTDTVSHPMFSLVKSRSSTRWHVRQKTSQQLLVSIIFRVGYLRNEAKKRKKGPKEFDWSKATFHHFVAWMKPVGFLSFSRHKRPTTRLPKLTASLHLKNDGLEDDPFLLGWPMFRGELLVPRRASAFRFVLGQGPVWTLIDGYLPRAENIDISSTGLTYCWWTKSCTTWDG